MKLDEVISGSDCRGKKEEGPETLTLRGCRMWPKHPETDRSGQTCLRRGRSEASASRIRKWISWYSYRGRHVTTRSRICRLLMIGRAVKLGRGPCALGPALAAASRAPSPNGGDQRAQDMCPLGAHCCCCTAQLVVWAPESLGRISSIWRSGCVS